LTPLRPDALDPGGSISRPAIPANRPIAYNEFVKWRLGNPHFVSFAVLAVLTFVMVFPASVGERPYANDHTVHFTKAWKLRQMVLEDGRLWGWNDSWSAGYPMLYDYPPGGELWVNLTHTLLLGLVDLSQAYGISLWLLHLLLAISLYRVGTKAGQPAVGLIAALLFLLEDGGHGQYVGWHWTMYFGVWPVALSLAFCVLAVSFLFDLSEKPRPIHRLSYALCVGAAVLCHPLAIVHFGLLVPVALVLSFVCLDRRSATVFLGRVVSGTAIGFLLSGVWLVPFLSASAFHDRQGWDWVTWTEFGENLVQGQISPKIWVYTTVLGVIGGLALLFSKRLDRLLIGVGVFIPFVTGASSFVGLFKLTKISPAFEWLQYPRFVTVAFPYLCVAAGFAVVTVFGHTFREGWPPLRHTAPVRSFVILATALAVTAPILIPACRALLRERVERPLPVASEREDSLSRAEFIRWATAEVARDPRFFRVALVGGFATNHEQLDLVTQVPIGLHKEWFIPAVQFSYLTGAMNADTLRALDVHYVVSDGGHPLGVPLRYLGPLGEWRLYEFEGWDGCPVDAGGGATVDIVRWQDNEIVFDVTGGTAEPLRTNRAYFDRWRADRDGQTVQLEPLSVDGVDIPLLGMRSAPPGRYTMRFEAGRPELVGALLSVVGLLGCGWLAFRRR